MFFKASGTAYPQVETRGGWGGIISLVTPCDETEMIANAVVPQIRIKNDNVFLFHVRKFLFHVCFHVRKGRKA